MSTSRPSDEILEVASMVDSQYSQKLAEIARKVRFLEESVFRHGLEVLDEEKDKEEG
jgi:hypothetical protein